MYRFKQRKQEILLGVVFSKTSEQTVSGTLETEKLGKNEFILGKK